MYTLLVDYSQLCIVIIYIVLFIEKFVEFPLVFGSDKYVRIIIFSFFFALFYSFLI